MTARRWPVITMALIAINVAVFLFTSSALEEESPPLRDARVQILNLAAEHPELTLQPEGQRLVDTFKQSDPAAWARLQNPYRDVINAYDAKVKLMDNPALLQKEMDTLCAEYVKIDSASLPERYAFVPARPTPISYLTANFLHGGWLHLIGNSSCGLRDLFLRTFGAAGCTRFSISSQVQPLCSSMPGLTRGASFRL